MPERVALVTGASRGIGRAIAQELAKSHSVAVNFSNNIEEAKATLSSIEESGGEGILVPGDVSEASDVERVFSEIEDAFGPVAVLVNNAGVRRDTLAARMSDEAWDQVLSVDLSGAFLCARRALRPMISQRYGRIVNITSVAGVRGIPGQANYCAAKAGLIGMTKSLAREVGRKNVTVNALAPGLVETELTTSLDEKRYEDIVAEIPVGRAASPEEMAGIVEFLCSDKAAYINGAVLVADGGMTA